jgi:uncharacterized membrane protein YoaK (UPF0700 family)
VPLRHLTARHRSFAADWQLAAILAFTAGAVDVSGYLALHQFTSHMSGTVATIAAEIDAHKLAVLTPPALVLLCFLAGAATCSLLVNWSRRRNLEGLFAIPILCEAALLTATAVFYTPHRLLLTLALLSFAMGLQNAVITKISHAVIRTTHITGMITDIGIELGRALYWNRSTGRTPGHAPVRSHPQHLLLLTLLVTLFFAGGALGGITYPRFGFANLLPFAFVLALIALLPIAADLRHPTQP